MLKGAVNVKKKRRNLILLLHRMIVPGFYFNLTIFLHSRPKDRADIWNRIEIYSFRQKCWHWLRA